MGKDCASKAIGCFGILGSISIGIFAFFLWARDLRLHITAYPNFDGVLAAFVVTLVIGACYYLFTVIKPYLKSILGYFAIGFAIIVATLILFFPLDAFISWLFWK
jgi:hypothetical protein